MSDEIVIRTTIQPVRPISLTTKILKEAVSYTIVEQEIPEEGAFRTYVLDRNGVGEGTKINIPNVKGSSNISVTESGGEFTVTSKTYTHEQGESSDVWVINHNLNKNPDIVLVDSSGKVFRGAVEYNDLNTCTVKLLGETTGKAYLN